MGADQPLFGSGSTAGPTLLGHRSVAPGTVVVMGYGLLEGIGLVVGLPLVMGALPFVMHRLERGLDSTSVDDGQPQSEPVRSSSTARSSGVGSQRSAAALVRT